VATGRAQRGGAGRLRLDAILLAAGAGTRFGGAKLRASWRGRPLIEAALATALAAPVREVIVVTGADPAVAALAEGLAASRAAGPTLRIVFAAHHADGMGASLAAGATALAGDGDGVFVFLADMPLVPHDIAPRLARALAGGALAAAPVHAGRRGHPALFSAGLLPDLARLGGDRGAREVLEGLGPRLALVETDDPGVLTDVDRPRDLFDPIRP
jgi:molybdenum cofactor cytidylyltransferase